MMLKFNIGEDSRETLIPRKLIAGRRSFASLSRKPSVLFPVGDNGEPPPSLNTPLRIQLAAIARGSSDYADGNN